MTTLLPGVAQVLSGNSVSQNSSLAAQVLTAATEALITGSACLIPDTGLQKGSRYRVKLFLDKTAAGVATSAYKLGLVYGGVTVALAGVNSLLTFTKPAGTAAADVGVVELALEVVTVGADAAEAGSVVGQFVMDHNLAATGHLQIPTSVQTGSDTTTATILAQPHSGGGSMVLTITTGAADVSSVLFCESQLFTPPADNDDD